ncbi:MAG TPA: GtrA family protein, partial [Candidatus Udaeobacter sp.]|nr:GtrA family protein [Candidatus Udaeobacter sp.]
NSRYTFGNRLAAGRQRLGMSVRFIAWNGILLVISLLMLAVLTEWWRVNEVIAKLIVTAVTVLLNFYGSRKWVFASGGTQTESS